jgi:hypothetical protein
LFIKSCCWGGNRGERLRLRLRVRVKEARKQDKEKKNFYIVKKFCIFGVEK